MKTSWLSGNGALKLLLLLTSLSHHYSGLVTGAAPAKGICASIAADKPVDFFLVGRNPDGRLLITAKPDYLVYELPDDLFSEDTLNISRVKPVPLSRYDKALFTSEQFKSFDAQSGKVVAFTHGFEDSDNTYLKMISVDLKLLVSFSMGPLIERINVTDNFTVPDASQEFVSSTEKREFRQFFYSFYKDNDKGFLRKEYSLDMEPNMSAIKVKYTCKAKDDNMVLRSVSNKCVAYQIWAWASSPKGWCEATVDGNSTFYLFEAKNQMVSIFDQDDPLNNQNDVTSVVRQKTYKDFFVCPAPKVTTSTTSAQPNTASNVTEVANRTTVTSITLVHNASTKASPDSVQTSTKKPKFAVWIIILIVVLLLAIIITVLAVAWYFYGGKKTSDTKPDKIASKGTMPNVRSTVSGGKQSSVVTSKVLSAKVIPSKVASSAKVQSSKQSVGAGMPRDALKVKATSSAGKTKVGTKLAGPKVSASKQLVAGQSKADVGGKATGKTGGISPTGIKLKANSSAASKASIRSSMVAPLKGPEAKVQGLKAKK